MSKDISLSFSQSVHPRHAKPTQVSDAERVHVKWIAATINPSDINQLEGTYALQPCTFPAIGGNEGVGRVVHTGSAVQQLHPGQLVIPALPGFGSLFNDWPVIN